MTITYNGNKTELADGTLLKDFLSERGYRIAVIAVEINLQIIPKSQYDSTIINDGDNVEVVSFMGGG